MSPLSLVGIPWRPTKNLRFQVSVCPDRWLVPKAVSRGVQKVIMRLHFVSWLSLARMEKMGKKRQHLQKQLKLGEKKSEENHGETPCAPSNSSTPYSVLVKEPKRNCWQSQFKHDFLLRRFFSEVLPKRSAFLAIETRHNCFGFCLGLFHLQ